MTTLSSDIESIPINLIRQHQFCPRIPWYKLVLKFDPPEQAWMIQGKQWHDKQHDLQKRRVSLYSSDNAIHHHEAWVHCPELGIHGQVDHLIEEQEYSIVIEYKIDSKTPTLGQKLQVIGYIFAARTTFDKPVKFGVILKGHKLKQHRIQMTPLLEDQFHNNLFAIKKNVQIGYLPDSSAEHAKCAQCEYLRYCNDR